MKLLKIKLLVILLLSINIALVAHPHLFAGVDIDYDLTRQDTLIITQRWMFDDLTSMIILEDFDTNCDDKISAKELLEVKRTVIPGLKEKSFYTDLVINNKNIKFDKIHNFSVGNQDIYVFYQFDIRVPVTFDNGKQIIKLNIYDRDFYTKFFVNSSSGLKVTKADNITHSFEVYENKNKSYYFGQLNPLEVKLTINKDTK